MDIGQTPLTTPTPTVSQVPIQPVSYPQLMPQQFQPQLYNQPLIPSPIQQPVSLPIPPTPTPPSVIQYLTQPEQTPTYNNVVGMQYLNQPATPSGINQQLHPQLTTKITEM